MRDNVRLATDVYLPYQSSSLPVVVIRTPYDKNALEEAAQEVTRRGYVFVAQDTRGRFASEGENLPFIGDGWSVHADAYDTLEWIAEQPWCNGKIATIGGSATGFTQLAAAGSGTQRITCQHIISASPNEYRHMVFTGGVFKKSMVEGWLRETAHSEDSIAYWTEHPTFDDFWREPELAPRYGLVDWPAVHVGGWHDMFVQGTIDAFLGYQTKGGPGARSKQKLVMGPWTHAMFVEEVGELVFPGANVTPNNIHDLWRWLEHNLEGADNGIDGEAVVTYYVMGDVFDPEAPGNVWRTAEKWPPVRTEMIPFYLHDDGSISTSKPAGGKPVTYVYDPADPVPTAGGPQLFPPAGPMNQKEVESRPDLLVFTSEPLSEPIEVTGRVTAELWASSDAPDTDFMVKLCDVYPDGRSYNVCEGVLRARFRESLSEEKLMEPGQVYPFSIDLWSTSIIFNKGHRLRVQVTSSSDPGYDPNPNTGEPFRSSDRIQVARNTIYMDAEHPSHILLPVAEPEEG